MAEKADPFLRAKMWRDKGALNYLYEPGRMPYKVMEGLDFMDSYMALKGNKEDG